MLILRYEDKKLSIYLSIRLIITLLLNFIRAKAILGLQSKLKALWIRYGIRITIEHNV